MLVYKVRHGWARPRWQRGYLRRPDLIRLTGAEAFWHEGCCNGPDDGSLVLMTPTEREALSALLAPMRTLYADLAERNAGVCLLHLEAAIAALESHLNRNGVPLIEVLRQELPPVETQTRAAAE